MSVSARRLVLASASPARLGLLRHAGFDPVVIVSGVDEAAAAAGIDDPAEIVAVIAGAKASAVATRTEAVDSLVVGCDSLFEQDGAVWGKPKTPAEATARIRRMRERSGVLHTGHCLVDTASGEEAAAVASTTVWFGPMTDLEVDAYVATGEPLDVAGAFTLDGRAAPFVVRIEGDPSNVIGLSLPLLRDLLARLGVSVADLWI